MVKIWLNGKLDNFFNLLSLYNSLLIVILFKNIEKLNIFRFILMKITI